MVVISARETICNITSLKTLHIECVGRFSSHISFYLLMYDIICGRIEVFLFYMLIGLL